MGLEAEDPLPDCPNRPLTAEYGTGMNSELQSIWQNNPEHMQGMKDENLMPHLASYHNGADNTNLENIHQHHASTMTSQNRLDQVSPGGYRYQMPVMWTAQDHWIAGSQNPTTNIPVYVAA